MTEHFIDSFEGEFRFLSNFDVSDPTLKNRLWGYPSVEHFYQAMKTTDETRRQMIKMADTPGGAKRLGNAPQTILKPDWDKRRHKVMSLGLWRKFSPETELAEKLVQTGEATLVEGNTWHDNYWGICHCGRASCDGTGLNYLGRHLVILRSALVELTIV